MKLRGIVSDSYSSIYHSQNPECKNWEWGRGVSFLGIHQSDINCSVGCKPSLTYPSANGPWISSPYLNPPPLFPTSPTPIRTRTWPWVWWSPPGGPPPRPAPSPRNSLSQLQNAPVKMDIFVNYKCTTSTLFIKVSDPDPDLRIHLELASLDLDLLTKAMIWPKNALFVSSAAVKMVTFVTKIGQHIHCSSEFRIRLELASLDLDLLTKNKSNDMTKKWPFCRRCSSKNGYICNYKFTTSTYTVHQSFGSGSRSADSPWVGFPGSGFANKSNEITKKYPSPDQHLFKSDFVLIPRYNFEPLTCLR